MLTDHQWQKYNQLIDCKLEILVALREMKDILKQTFPNEYEIAYEHWIKDISLSIKKSNEFESKVGLTIEDTLSRIQKLTNTHFGD